MRLPSHDVCVDHNPHSNNSIEPDCRCKHETGLTSSVAAGQELPIATAALSRRPLQRLDTSIQALLLLW